MAGIGTFNMDSRRSSRHPKIPVATMVSQLELLAKSDSSNHPAAVDLQRTQERMVFDRALHRPSPSSNMAHRLQGLEIAIPPTQHVSRLEARAWQKSLPPTPESPTLFTELGEETLPVSNGEMILAAPMVADSHRHSASTPSWYHDHSTLHKSFLDDSHLPTHSFPADSFQHLLVRSDSISSRPVVTSASRRESSQGDLYFFPHTSPTSDRIDKSKHQSLYGPTPSSQMNTGMDSLHRTRHSSWNANVMSQVKSSQLGLNDSINLADSTRPPPSQDGFSPIGSTYSNPCLEIGAAKRCERCRAQRRHSPATDTANDDEAWKIETLGTANHPEEVQQMSLAARKYNPLLNLAGAGSHQFKVEAAGLRPPRTSTRRPVFSDFSDLGSIDSLATGADTWIDEDSAHDSNQRIQSLSSVLLDEYSNLVPSDPEYFGEGIEMSDEEQAGEIRLVPKPLFFDDDWKAQKVYTQSDPPPSEATATMRAPEQRIWYGHAIAPVSAVQLPESPDQVHSQSPSRLRYTRSMLSASASAKLRIKSHPSIRTASASRNQPQSPRKISAPILMDESQYSYSELSPTLRHTPLRLADDSSPSSPPTSFPRRLMHSVSSGHRSRLSNNTSTTSHSTSSPIQAHFHVSAPKESEFEVVGKTDERRKSKKNPFASLSSPKLNTAMITGAINSMRSSLSPRFRKDLTISPNEDDNHMSALASSQKDTRHKSEGSIKRQTVFERMLDHHHTSAEERAAEKRRQNLKKQISLVAVLNPDEAAYSVRPPNGGWI
jgi:hypothetical protein